MLDDNLHIKVADFGSAKIIQGNNEGETAEEAAARSFVGTAEYVSPELLKSDPVSREADFWAFGCVVYQMLTGKSPFKAATDYLIFQKIKNLEYVIPDDFPEHGKNIVEGLLVSDPNERFGSKSKGGIQAIKDHPFFEGIDWENIFTSNAPPLKERLEEEAKRNPVVTPQFNIPNVDEDDDDEEDIWIRQNKEDPFKDGSPAISQRTQDIGSTSNSPTPKSPPPVPQIITTSSTSSYLNRNSVLHAEGNMKDISQMSSAASSVHSSIPDRSTPQPHPPW